MVELHSGITLEFLHPDGRPVLIKELAETFRLANGLDDTRNDQPIQISVDGKISQAGNLYYDFSITGFPLPDGLNTLIRAENNLLPFGPTGSSKAGNPTRKSRAEIIIRDSLYVVEAYISKGKKDFYIKMIAHKKAAQSVKPRGGGFI
jgi:hypothetical protein